MLENKKNIEIKLYFCTVLVSLSEAIIVVLRMVIGILNLNMNMRRCALFVFLMVIVMITVFTTSACTDKKPVVVDSVVVADTVDSVVVDTLESMIEQQPMPKAADELFDDFFFNFAGNRKLQLKRIAFPLPVFEEDKPVQKITRKQWQIDHFFMAQEYYTLIFDSHKHMEVVKDTTVSHAVVERIDLTSEHVKQYVFDRQRGLWRLTSIVNKSVRTGYNADFLIFYNRFATDNDFQEESLDETVTFTAPDPDDDFATITGTMLPEQWTAFKPTFFPRDTIYNILYGYHYKESNHKLFVVRGISNGLEMEMTFNKRQGRWKLSSFSY